MEKGLSGSTSDPRTYSCPYPRTYSCSSYTRP